MQKGRPIGAARAVVRWSARVQDSLIFKPGWPMCAFLVARSFALSFAILATVARLQPVAFWIVDQLWPAFSMVAMPALRSTFSAGPL